MGNEIMTRNMESMENSGRIQGEFALNSKGIRAEFSEDPRLTRGQTPCAFLFPRWEQNIPTLGTKHSHAGNKTGLRLCLDEITSRAPRHFSDLKGTECGVANGSSPTRLRLVAARNNEAFSFLYQENLDRFEEVRFFDPETDVPCFDNIDLLYLPGGYPEKHLEALVKNEACRKAIKDFAEQGGHVVAECGGMMYLCESIMTDMGEYPMCGVLPYRITAHKADRKLSLGYRQFELDGEVYRGHEFHYTQFLGEVPSSATQVYDAKGNPVATPVFRYKNVLASYTHLY